MGDDQLDGSAFVSLAGALAGGRTDDLKEVLSEDIVPNASGAAVDATLSGTILGVARSELTEAVAQASEETEQPIIHARERELRDGSVGIHLIVSNPEARVFRGDNSVLVKIGQFEDEQHLGFKPGGVERLQGEGEMDAVAEFMVYPTTYSPPEESIEADYPPEDEADESAESDETDTSGEESIETTGKGDEFEAADEFGDDEIPEVGDVDPEEIIEEAEEEPPDDDEE